MLKPPFVRLAAMLVLAAGILAACQVLQPQPQPKTALPPANAQPSDVVASYLQALADGDCGKAIALSSEELNSHAPMCERPRVTGFSELSCQGACPTGDEAVYAVELTVAGSAGTTLREGANPMLIQVVQLPSGVWRVNGMTQSP